METRAFGKYVLLELRAQNDASRVWSATRAVGGHPVMLEQRTGDVSSALRIERSAKVLVALSHAGIARVLEVGVHAGVTFVARERVGGAAGGGSTVAEIVAGGGRITAEEAAYIGAEASRALAYARRDKNLVLDVGTDGVTIDEEGRVVLTRFDIAPSATKSSARALATLLLEALGGAAGASPSTGAPSAGPPKTGSPKTGGSHVDIRLLPLDDVLARAASDAAGPREEDDLAEALRKFLAGIEVPDVVRALAEKARAAAATRTPLAIDDEPFALGAAAAPPGKAETLALHADRTSWTSVAPRDKPRTPPSIPPPTRALPSMPPPPKMPLALDDPRDSVAVRRRDRLVLIAVLAAIAATIAILVAPAIRNATRVAHPDPPPAHS